MMTKKQAAMFVVCALLSVSSARANNMHYNMRGTWHFDFMHIPFAKLWLAVDESNQHYKLTAGFKSSGILGMFKRIRSLSQSQGAPDANGMQQPAWFQHDNEKAGKHIRLNYAPDGSLTQRSVIPEDDPWHRPPIALEAVARATSPGNALFTLREKLRRLSKTEGSRSVVQLYEGKRLANITFEYMGAKSLSVNKRLTATHKLRVTRELLDGYTQKEIRRHQEGDPQVFLYVRQSDFFPIAMHAKLSFGTLHAVWLDDAPEQ